MLEIINSLKPFFEDNYRRINVREYARLQNISPPTASKLLEKLRKETLLRKEIEKQYIYYYANKDSKLFIDFSRIYWKIRLEKKGLVDYLEKELLSPIIILFGSLAKAEVRKDSDLDLAIFSVTNKQIKLEKYEKLLKRNIQIFIFNKRENIKSKELLNNVLNGYKIKGKW